MEKISKTECHDTQEKAKEAAMQACEMEILSIISNYQNIVNTEQSIIDSQDVKGPNPSKCTCNK